MRDGPGADIGVEFTAGGSRYRAEPFVAFAGGTGTRASAAATLAAAASASAALCLPLSFLERRLPRPPASALLPAASDSRPRLRSSGIAAPAAAAGSEEDVSRWLMTDEEPAGMFDTTQSVRTVAVADPAADSSSIHAEHPIASSGSGVTAGGAGSGISKSSSALAIEAVKESKTKPGMLPQQPKQGTDTSRDAAAEALKKFFGGR